AALRREARRPGDACGCYSDAARNRACSGVDPGAACGADRPGGSAARGVRLPLTLLRANSPNRIGIFWRIRRSRDEGLSFFLQELAHLRTQFAQTEKTREVASVLYRHQSRSGNRSGSTLARRK